MPGDPSRANRFDNRILRDQGTGGNDRVVSNARAVEYDGANPNYAAILDGAAVQRGAMPNGDPFAEFDAIQVSLSMHNRTVLNIGIGADANRINVAAQHGARPDTDVLRQNHVANHLGGFVHIAGGRDAPA